MPKKCEACNAPVDKSGGLRSHVDAERPIHLCRDCYRDKDVWLPLLHSRYGALIEKRKAQHKKPRPKKPVSASFGHTERAEESRRRGRERSREVRGQS